MGKQQNDLFKGTGFFQYCNIRSTVCVSGPEGLGLPSPWSRCFTLNDRLFVVIGRLEASIYSLIWMLLRKASQKSGTLITKTWSYLVLQLSFRSFK